MKKDEDHIEVRDDGMYEKSSGREIISPLDIESLLSTRKAAIKDKDMGLLSDIQDSLLKMGVEVTDTPQGTAWKLT